MKKLVLVFMTGLMLMSLTACGSSEPKVEITAESSLTALKEKVSSVSSITIFDESTDPNGILGRPGRYIGKGDFFDSRIDNLELNAGTIEFFSSTDDCKDRYEYLCKLSDPELGAFGVNEYIYKYNLAIFRVSYDLIPSQAEEYKTAMDEIMGEVSTQYEVK